MPAMKQKQRGQSGFTLVETLVAMVIFVVGVLAVAMLILYGIRLQAFSREVTRSNAFAKAKIEELRVTTPRPVIGGDLNNNVAGYFDIRPLPPDPPNFTRRWVVAAGPAGTLDVTVAVVARIPNMQLPTVQIRAFLP